MTLHDEIADILERNNTSCNPGSYPWRHDKAAWIINGAIKPRFDELNNRIAKLKANIATIITDDFEKEYPSKYNEIISIFSAIKELTHHKII